MIIKKKAWWRMAGFVVVAGLSLLFPKAAQAHAFGQLYTLPIPVWLYLYGGGAVVFVSFVIIGYFVNHDRKNKYPVYDLSKLKFQIFIPQKILVIIVKALSISLFCLTIAAGYLGTPYANYNFSTLFVWITFWLGLTYITAILGNLWNLMNPWKIIVDSIEKLKGSQFKGYISYPGKLGYFPALSFYFIFIWLELLSNGWGVKPAFLSKVIVAYTAINFVGVALIGTGSWFKYGEFFSVFFALIGKLAPLSVKNGHLILRFPFVGLLEEKSDSFSLLMFILFMLSSTAFDGFRGTTAWKGIDRLIASWAGTNSAYQAGETIFLGLSLLFFLILYLYAILFLKMATKSKIHLLELASKFAPSLLPIAFAYNVAHYYTLLIVQGQTMISTLSDPLGKGWNLFGTAAFMPNVGIIGASFVWHSQVSVIIIGHIAAVYIAHVISLQVFNSRRLAVISQLPVLILMITYTIIGLWILSQPLTLGR